MNPLFQNAQNGLESNSNISAIKQALNTLNIARNPSHLFSTMLQNNPTIKQIVDMCGNRNPRDVFFEECQKRGIDPQDILRNLR